MTRRESLAGPDCQRRTCLKCVGLGTVPECDVRNCRVTAHCVHGNNVECDACDGVGFVVDGGQT